MASHSSAVDWSRVSDRGRPPQLIVDLIASHWAATLGLTHVDPRRTFFELGGDSIDAVMLLSRLRRSFDIEWTLADVLDLSTIDAMAERLAAAARRQTAVAPQLLPTDVPLTLDQEGIWLVQQLNPTSAAYHVIDARRLTGSLDLGAIREALDTIVTRHSALRSTFPRGGDALQRVAATGRASFEHVVMQGASASERRRRATDAATLAAGVTFDLERGPLCRVHVFTVAEDEAIVLLSAHHLVFDDWSITTFWQELAELYNARVSGVETTLPPPSHQLAAVAESQRVRREGARAAENRAYWSVQLSDLAVLELPTDAPRPRTMSFRGRTDTRPLSPRLVDALIGVSQRHGVSLFVTMLAAFKLLLARHTGQHDIAIGVPMTNRDVCGADNVIGTFVTPHVLRSRLQLSSSFASLLGQLHGTVRDAFAHKEVSLAQLVADLNPRRDPSRHPFYQLMFNFIAGPLPSTKLRGIEVTGVNIDTGGAQLDLTMTVICNADAQQVSINYNSDLFLPTTIARIFDRFERLLASIADRPECPLSELECLDVTERTRLAAWSRGAEMPVEDSTIPLLFERQAASTPDGTALVEGAQRVTYSTLNGRANRLARVLIARGAGRETRVGVALDRSVDLVVSLLATMKCGAACVPLDPGYPPDRIASMLVDGDVGIVITRRNLVGSLPIGSVEPLIIDELGELLARADPSNPTPTAGPMDVATVHFTSGSTGRPVGVPGLHRGTVNRLAWVWASYPFKDTDVCAAITSPVFVDSAREILAPLCRGIPTVLVPDHAVADPHVLAELLATHGVTRLNLVPSLLSVLVNAGDRVLSQLKSVGTAFVSGEALTAELVSRCLQRWPSLRVVNVYGCSEASGDSTWFEVPPDWTGSMVPLGRPLPNHDVLVLDETGGAVPVGVPGEIYIGGVGLSPGYLQSSELTAQRFVVRDDVLGGRFYRTGDLGSYSTDGLLRYHGRRDRQIKLRGMRVELDDIEAVVLRHPAVREVAAALTERSNGATAVVAHVVLDPGAVEGVSELRAFARTHLPPHMVPGIWMTSDGLPRLPNGKINRRGLPTPGPEAARATQAIGARPPATDIERMLASMFARLLGVENVTTSDDFFELGGHSLLAATLVSEIARELGVAVPLVRVFEAPTVETLARVLASSEPPRRKSIVRLSSAGRQAPFFCVHGIDGGTWGYSTLAQSLDDDRPFLGLEAHGIDGREGPDSRLEDMAARYVAAIMLEQPEGPILLGGYSFGGYIAYEMAQQLRLRGRTVAALVMFDTPAPLGTYWTFRWTVTRTLRLLANAPRWMMAFAQLDWEHMRSRVRRHGRKVFTGWLPVQRRGNAETIDLGAYQDTMAHLPPELRRIVEVSAQALMYYRVRPYDGSLVLLRARTQPLLCSHDPTMGWSSLALGGVRVLDVPGSHHTILDNRYVSRVAARLREALAQSSADVVAT